MRHVNKQRLVLKNLGRMACSNPLCKAFQSPLVLPRQRKDLLKNQPQTIGKRIKLKSRFQNPRKKHASSLKSWQLLNLRSRETLTLSRRARINGVPTRKKALKGSSRSMRGFNTGATSISLGPSFLDLSHSFTPHTLTQLRQGTEQGSKRLTKKSMGYTK